MYVSFFFFRRVGLLHCVDFSFEDVPFVPRQTSFFRCGPFLFRTGRLPFFSFAPPFVDGVFYVGDTNLSAFRPFFFGSRPLSCVQTFPAPPRGLPRPWTLGPALTFFSLCLIFFFSRSCFRSPLLSAISEQCAFPPFSPYLQTVVDPPFSPSHGGVVFFSEVDPSVLFCLPVPPLFLSARTFPFFT